MQKPVSAVRWHGTMPVHAACRRIPRRRHCSKTPSKMSRCTKTFNVNPLISLNRNESTTCRAVNRDVDQTSASATAAEVAATQTPCCYDGVIFDMDGTLTISNIDFLDMRTRTGIASGDLFTVMESWDDGDKIKRSMDVILELEAQAAGCLETQPGLREVLQYLKDNKVRVGLVTRNTRRSVDAFFGTLGKEWRPLFSPILTREFKYVKPDKRTLQHFSEAWAIPPCRLLMVGDSVEDVETGNAAGTATCLIAGGGNELPPPPPQPTSASAPAATRTATAPPAPTPSPPAGAAPSFAVQSLYELQDKLAAGDSRVTPLGWGTAIVSADYSSSSSSGEESDGEWGGLLAYEQMFGAAVPGGGAPNAAQDAGGPGVSESLSSMVTNAQSASPLRAGGPGSPPPGIDFLDFMFLSGTVKGASCSFPRIISDQPTDAHPGDKVLHFGCGDAALTKLLASSGLQVVAMDADVSAARTRGLLATPLPFPLSRDALLSCHAPRSFDAVVMCAPPQEHSQEQTQKAEGAVSRWLEEGVIEGLAGLKKAEGRLCMEAWVEDPPQLQRRLEEAGLQVLTWRELATSPSGRRRIRFLAR